MADPFAGLEGRSRKAFQTATPRGVRLANGDPGTLAQITAIDGRTTRIKRKARDHFDKFVEPWVAAEAVRILAQRAGLSKETAPREALAKQLATTAVMAEARRNVHVRFTNRLTKLNFINTRLSNAAVRNMQAMQPGQGMAPARSLKNPVKRSPSR